MLRKIENQLAVQSRVTTGFFFAWKGPEECLINTAGEKKTNINNARAINFDDTGLMSHQRSPLPSAHASDAIKNRGTVGEVKPILPPQLVLKTSCVVPEWCEANAVMLTKQLALRPLR